MPPSAFFLILLSVLFHVSWNLLSKAARPSAAFYLVTSVAAAAVSLPFVCWAGIGWRELPAAFWWCFFCSCGANLLYYTGLFLAYRRSGISLAYPLVRALPVLFIAAVTMLFGIGKPPSPTAFAGMGIAFIGCLLMPLEHWRDLHWRNYFSPALGVIVLAALGTTFYTVFDSLAIPQLSARSGGAEWVVCAAYMGGLETAIAIGLSGFLLCPNERKNLSEVLRRPAAPMVSGIFTVGAYVLVLLAMPLVVNVSFVQAFRLMGLPLSVAAGVFLLKEKCSLPRLVGVCAIAAGLMLAAAG